MFKSSFVMHRDLTVEGFFNQIVGMASKFARHLGWYTVRNNRYICDKLTQLVGPIISPLPQDRAIETVEISTLDFNQLYIYSCILSCHLISLLKAAPFRHDVPESSRNGVGQSSCNKGSL